MIDNGTIFEGRDCEFCDNLTRFKKVYDQFGQAWWLEGLDGAGSDHLAIWCGTCGPKHRSSWPAFARHFNTIMFNEVTLP